MLRPEPMSRTIIVASKSEERRIVETLHDLRVVHLVDHVEAKDGELAGFRLGSPLEGAGPASALLVRLRALQRTLGLEGARPATAFQAAEIDRRASEAITDAERETNAITDAREAARTELDQLADEARRIEPLAGIPLKFEDLRGYRTVKVFVGTAGPAFQADVAAAVPNHELFTAPSGAFALFVPSEKAEAAADALFKHGYKELDVPAESTGAIDARLGAIASRRAALESQIARAEEDLARVRAKWGDFILAADEHLAIAVEKAEAPLRFASTKNTLMIDAWVPASEVERVKTTLDRATNGKVHVEVLAATGDHAHAHTESGALHGEKEGHGAGHHEEDAPPTKLNHRGYPKPFAFFTQMFSLPKHNEIDPTTVLAYAFPLFYGFMIGDLGYGIIMAVLGFLLIRKLGHLDGGKQMGTALLTAGVVAAAFGGIVFSDAFGIPFGAHITETQYNELHAAALQNGVTDCEEFAHHHAETTWSCIFSGNQALGVPDYSHAHNWWQLSKLTDMSTMLVLSIIVAVLHLGIGLVFGMVNEFHHSKKHATAKFAWLLLLTAFFLVSIQQTTGLSHLSEKLATGLLAPAMNGMVMLGLIGLAAVLLLATEGGIALVEMPSLLANILSYTRLAGVAVAKAAMAVAFNGLFLVGMVMGHKGIAIVIIGAILLIVCQLLVLVLGILSSGIQAIRLNYVEFFTKFYKGGGKPFTPFGRTRQFTITAQQQTME